MVDLRKYKNIEIKDKPPTKKQPIPLSVVPPQESLKPIFNSPFYMTPDEPADPRDCDRYPDSPYCGGFPWTFTPVGIEPSIVLDGCNVGVELKPVLAWTKLPPVQLVYREQSEECNKKPSGLPLPKANETFIPLPGLTEEGCLYRIKVNWQYIAIQDPTYNNLAMASYGNFIRTSKYVQYPTFTYAYCWGPIYGLLIRKLYGINTNLHTSQQSVIFEKEPVVTHALYVLSRKYEGNLGYDAPLDHSFYLFNEGYGTTIYQRYAAVKNKRTIDESLLDSAYCFLFAGGDSLSFSPSSGDLQEIWCSPDPKVDFYPPPPPPPPPRCDCNMTCCPDTAQNDQLLRSLIQKVDKLSQIVGIDEYPASLPASLISKDEGFFGNLIPNSNINIPNMTRLLGWYIERFDEVMGQWEIPIEVKDTDPTQPGDQPVGFKLPNMAEAIAEMFGLMLQTSINSQIAINMQTRTMLEVGQNKQQGFKAYMLVLAIADHLGFDYKEIKHKIPMLFDINQTQLDKLLQESEIEVSAVEYTDKEDLKTVLLELRQAAAIIRAVHWRKFDLNSDVAQGVKDLVMGLVKTSDEVNDNKDDDSGKDKFEDFLEDVERGFTTSSGITDTDHPYGRNYNERPRIKEIGQESPGV